MGKKSGSGIRIRDEQPGSYSISESLYTIVLLKILKFCDADPEWEKFGSGMEKIRIHDLG
jgi:hypothetical protein